MTGSSIYNFNIGVLRITLRAFLDRYNVKHRCQVICPFGAGSSLLSTWLFKSYEGPVFTYTSATSAQSEIHILSDRQFFQLQNRLLCQTSSRSVPSTRRAYFVSWPLELVIFTEESILKFTNGIYL